MNNRVLLVEDDHRIGPLVQAILQKFHYQVILVDSMATLKATDLSGVELAITDFHLPDTDGLYVIQYLRGKFPNLPVIFTSGSGGSRGSDDDPLTQVIQKPYQFDVLVETVEKLLKK